MNVANIIVLLGAIGGLLAYVVAYLTHRSNQSEVHKQQRDEYTRSIAREVSSLLISPVTSTLTTLDKAIAVMSSKVDLMWTAQQEMALAAAQALHRPEPGRARFDTLLERWMDNQDHETTGTISDDEVTELRHDLEIIKNYKHEHALPPFPVYPGEQALATILLATMGVNYE